MSVKWFWLLRDEGPGQMGETVAKTHAMAQHLYGEAKRIGYVAAINLDLRAQHRTGDAQIRVEKSKMLGGKTDLDAYVYLTDPDNKRAALSIELGHDRYNDDGEVIGHVPGLHVVGDAVRGAVTRARVKG